MPKKKTNQTQEVIKYLKRHKHITSKIAFEQFGVTRLSSIIFRLKAKGYNIMTRMTEGQDRYQNHCAFADYVLVSLPHND